MRPEQWDKPEPSHVVASHARRAQQTATRTQALNATACILTSQGRVACAVGCRSCDCHNATLSSMPQVLHRPGAQPQWDAYLTGVYGKLPPYPFQLHALRWFFRCDCRLLSRNCRVSTAACKVPSAIAEWQERKRLEQQQQQLAWPKMKVAATPINWHRARWQDSCRPGAQAPLPELLPKVWLGSLPSIQDDAVARAAAFVGYKTNRFPNPEFWLSPWGWWAGPFLDAPQCLPSHSWVEVMRVLQPAETDYRSLFYYYAPGSGIYLNLGRTICCNHELNYDEELVDVMYPDSGTRRRGNRTVSYDCAFLAARSFWAPTWTRAPWKRKRASRDVARGVYHTIQRQSHAGNLLEIQEVRHDSNASASAPASACGIGLRTGWGAMRVCTCDSTRLILNCDG